MPSIILCYLMLFLKNCEEQLRLPLDFHSYLESVEEELLPLEWNWE